MPPRVQDIGPPQKQPKTPMPAPTVSQISASVTSPSDTSDIATTKPTAAPTTTTFLPILATFATSSPRSSKQCSTTWWTNVSCTLAAVDEAAKKSRTLYDSTIGTSPLRMSSSTA